jgi:TldD protein
VSVAERITTDVVDALRAMVPELLRDRARTLPHLCYADVRIEVAEGKMATAENGGPKLASADYAAALGVRALAGRQMTAPGYAGRALGVADLPRLAHIMTEELGHAYCRALANGEAKAETRDKLGVVGGSLVDARLVPVRVARDVVPAVYETDPRALPLDEVVRFTTEVAREVVALDRRLTYSSLATHTELSRELFCSTEGASIDQSFAHTQGSLYVVATGNGTSQEIYDVLGHQRGWEILTRGIHEATLEFPDFRSFARDLAREALELCQAPALPPTDGEVTVVTDPHYVALVAHEIVGHPSELDRGLKMETAYAGRSWLLRTLTATQLGQAVASPLVTAFSDPALPGYGHYAYDHEGTPASRVTHIERGIFRGFLNSRQTAAILGVTPNGHAKASDAALVPLIRMSNTVFAPGDRDPRDILGEVDHGYYVAGHRIPSIAESRENFRISARRVYEIRNGELGRLHRDGGLTADSRRYLMNVDAMGTDFRLFPIPNCGKGQPMQTKRLGNGGPTMRSRARLTGA